MNRFWCNKSESIEDPDTHLHINFHNNETKNMLERSKKRFPSISVWLQTLISRLFMNRFWCNKRESIEDPDVHLHINFHNTETKNKPQQAKKRFPAIWELDKGGQSLLEKRRLLDHYFRVLSLVLDSQLIKHHFLSKVVLD